MRLTMSHHVPIASLCALLAVSGCSPPGNVGKSTPAVDQLHAACAISMAQSVCRVSNDTSSNASLPPAATVFVAGVGPVDATAYRAIREGGDAMCETVRQSCMQAWDGTACKTARSLWPVDVDAVQSTPAGASANSANSSDRR